MQRILAIIEREMRRYLRSPALIFIALVLPLGQLIILGNSFGGKVQGVRLAVVDEDRGPEARRVREALQSVESTAKTFQVVLYQTEGEALRDVRSGRVKGAVIIPLQFSRLVHSENRPRLGLLLDNTDAFISSAISQALAGLVTSFNHPDVEPRLTKADCSRAGRVVSLCPLPAVHAPGRDHPGDVCLSDDRRWHGLYRRQIPWGA